MKCKKCNKPMKLEETEKYRTDTHIVTDEYWWCSHCKDLYLMHKQKEKETIN